MRRRSWTDDSNRTGICKRRKSERADIHKRLTSQYVQRTAPPMSPSVAVQISYPSQQRASEELPLTRSSTQHVTPRLTHDDIISDPSGPDPSTLAPVSNLLSAALHQSSSRQQSSSATLAELNTTSHGNRKPSNQIDKKVTDWRLVQRPVPKIESGPRWCRFCQINKPDRTHHCRHCGTCVLQFDRMALHSRRGRTDHRSLLVGGPVRGLGEPQSKVPESLLLMLVLYDILLLGDVVLLPHDDLSDRCCDEGCQCRWPGCGADCGVSADFLIVPRLILQVRPFWTFHFRHAHDAHTPYPYRPKHR